MDRRRFLAVLAGSGTLSTAGCLGGPSSGLGQPSPGGDGSSNRSNDGDTVGLNEGQTPPDFSLESVDNGTVSLRPLEKPTVLFFMAAWCTSCKQEESHLRQVRQQYGDNVRLISIDADPDRDTMQDLAAFKKQYGGDWIHVMATTQLIQTYRLTSLDTTYIINAEGVTAYKDKGVTSVNTFTEQLEKVLGAGQ